MLKFYSELLQCPRTLYPLRNDSESLIVIEYSGFKPEIECSTPFEATENRSNSNFIPSGKVYLKFLEDYLKGQIEHINCTVTFRNGFLTLEEQNWVEHNLPKLAGRKNVYVSGRKPILLNTMTCFTFVQCK